MKLITEEVSKVEFITEGKGSSQKCYIKGIFLQAEQVNRNGRMYPLSILSEEIGRYNDNYIIKNRAMGELNHPTSPTVNLDKVCHMITEMKKSGNDFIGKAKILTETPMGAIVKNLIDEGACLGVSSRGMGSLQKINGVNIVQKDFTLSAIDIVADPSAPGAFVNGIMEGKEWIWDNGILKEQRISEYHNQLKKTPKRKLERKALELFEDFLRRL